MQIKEVEQHKAEMHSLLDELSDKLKLDANDRLEVRNFKEFVQKMINCKPYESTQDKIK